MERFRETIEDCRLSDMGYQSVKFTWCNNREGNSFTKERLDRVFGNNGWHSLFSNSIVVNVLVDQRSHHSPLLLKCCN